MKSHELARKLLDLPDEDIEISVDMSVDDDSADNRVFSDDLCEIVDDSFMSKISLLFFSHEKNY